MYIVHCAFTVYSCNSICFFSFWSVKLSVQMLCFNQLSILKQYYLIIVQYSDPRNVFQVFQSCKEVTITCNLESNKHEYKYKPSTSLNYFHLDIGFQSSIATIDISWDVEPIFPTGAKEGETIEITTPPSWGAASYLAGDDSLLSSRSSLSLVLDSSRAASNR